MADRPKKRSPWRRLGRLALRLMIWGALGVTLLLAVLVALLCTDTGLEWARRLALDQTRTMLPGLSVERVTGNITRELVLEGVVLKDRFGGEAVRAKRLLLRYDLAALTDHSVRVLRLELDRPKVVIRTTQSGKLNLAELVVLSPDEEEPPAEPTTWTVALTTLKITSGSARYEAPSGQRFEVKGLGLLAGLGLDLATMDMRGSINKLAGRALIPGQPNLDLLLQGSGGRAKDIIRARTRLQLFTVERKATGKETGSSQQTKPLLPVTLASGKKITLDLDASGPLSHLGLKLRALLPGEGSVELAGWAGLDLEGDDPLQKYEAELKLGRINPALLVPKLVATNINLGLKLRGDGVPLQAGSEATLSLDAGPSSVMQYKLDRLKVSGGIKGEAWKLRELALAAAGAELQITGQGTLKKIEKSRIKLHVPSLDRLPLPASVPRLAGMVDADLTVKGPITRDLAVAGEVSGEGLALDALRLGSAKVTMDLRGLPHAPEGNLSLGATRVYSVKGKKRSLLLSRGAVTVSGTRESLTVKAGVGRPDLRGHLVLSASLSPELPPKKITARLVRLDLRALAALGGATKKLRARLLNRPRVTVELGKHVKLDPLRIATLGGELSARGVYRFTAQPRLEARLQVKKIRPVPGPPMSAELTARLGRRALKARLLADIGSKVSLEARLPVSYNGTVPTPSQHAPLHLSLRAPALDLGLINRFLPKAPALGGTVDVKLEGSGSLRAPRLDLALGLARLSSPYLNPVSGTARLSMGRKESSLELKLNHQRAAAGSGDQAPGARGPARLVTLNAGAPLTVARLLRGRRDLIRALARVPVQARLTVHQTPLVALASVSPLLKKASGSVAASVNLSGTLEAPRARGHVRLKDGYVAGQKLGSILARLKLGGDRTRTTGTLTLKLGKLKLMEASAVAMSPVPDILRKKNFTTLPLKVEAIIPKIQLSALRDYHRLLQITEGTLAGKVDLTGSIKAPGGIARLSLRDTRFNGQLLGDLFSQVSFDGRLIGLELRLKQGPTGHARGNLSYDLKKPEDMTASLDTGFLKIGFVKELVPALRELDGKLHGMLRISGGLQRPLIKGRLRLQGARVRVTGAPTLEKVDARVTLSQDRVRLVSLEARSGRGLITATGKVDLVNLRPTTFRLDARSTLFDLGVGALKNSAFFGNLSVDGKLSKSVLSADVRLSNGTLKMAGLGGDGDVLHSTKPLADVVFEQKKDPRGDHAARKGPGKPAPPLKLAIKIVVEPLRIRSEDFDVEAESDLRATTGPQGKLRLHGWAGLRKGGTLNIMGARYTVKRAKVRFTGKAEPNPSLDVLLSRHIQTVVVLIGVGGSARAHQISFKSDPPNYSEAQVISMIATGRVEESTDELDGDTGGAEQKTGQKMTMANAMANALIGAFAGKAVSKVGLDVARLNVKETDDEEAVVQLQAQAEVGKYLTRDLYVGYRRIFGATEDENENEGILEYTFLPRWMLSVFYGDNALGGVDLFWTFRY